MLFLSCYVPGKSLDKCMELKELGMTQDSAKVQRKMLLKMKREEEKIERRYHKAAQPESVFDFLNGQIFSKKGEYAYLSLIKDMFHCLIAYFLWRPRKGLIPLLVY